MANKLELYPRCHTRCVARDVKRKNYFLLPQLFREGPSAIIIVMV